MDSKTSTPDPRTELRPRLERLDLLLHREILRLRATYELSLDELRGLYIGDSQVDALIQEAAGRDDRIPELEALTGRAHALEDEILRDLSPSSPWRHLDEAFGLSGFEQDTVLLALAPEVAPKYETLYAYLNNDITRKHPTLDLALRLLAHTEDQRWEGRRLLHPGAALFRHGLLRLIPAPAERPARLNQGLQAAPVLVQSLLGEPLLDPGLVGLISLEQCDRALDTQPLSPALGERISGLSALIGAAPPVLVFEGRSGSGRRNAARGLANALGLPLLTLDLEAAANRDEPLPGLFERLGLQLRLGPALLYLTAPEAFSERGRPGAQGLGRLLATLPGPMILACGPQTPWRRWLQGVRALPLLFEEPGFEARLGLWREQAPDLEPELLEALADRFVLNPGQIAHTAATAKDLARLQHDDGPSEATLFEAARMASDLDLGGLASRVRRVNDWGDLVLPQSTLERVREIASAIAHRHQVYGRWGFEAHLQSGWGLRVLFSGPSGTGKTMTAGVIARDLGLDLLRIDLSAVVSKYIGETEKNLGRIFRAARASNAILLFDEADALFGKRSEVKDAHDRYANIEVAYLLQRMEDHDGVVILATNLSRNMDQAFTRRIQYRVDFPAPDAALRERLWRGMFTPGAPLADDLDLAHLARRFELTGGEIRNLVLEAAFLAARDQTEIRMDHLVDALTRHLAKQGKIPSARLFGTRQGVSAKKGAQR